MPTSAMYPIILKNLQIIIQDLNLQSTSKEVIWADNMVLKISKAPTMKKNYVFISFENIHKTADATCFDRLDHAWRIDELFV